MALLSCTSASTASALPRSCPSAAIGRAETAASFPPSPLRLHSLSNFCSSSRNSAGLRFRLQRHVSAAAQRRSRVVAAVATVVEPATKIVFPSALQPPGGGADLSLLGTGVREKSFAIVNVKVYGVALYTDLSAATASLPKWTVVDGGADAAIAANEGFFSALASAPGDKVVIIALARNVGGDQFVAALKEELEPRIAAASVAAPPGLLDSFGALFLERPLTKGMAIFVTWRHTSSLIEVAFAPDISSGTVPSSPSASLADAGALGEALWDIYLGKEGVSKTLRQSIAVNAPVLASA